MSREAVVLTERTGSVDIVRPVEDRLRRLGGGLGAVSLVAGLAGFLIWRPSVVGFPDAALFFLASVAMTFGLACLAFATWGGEWVITFEGRTATIRQELRTFGNLAVVDGFGYDDLGELCAVCDRDPEGRPAFRLFMVETENGRPLHIADFADEGSMRAAAKAIAGVHPSLRAG